MARPSKAVSARTGHVTKREIKSREFAEQAVLTGQPLREQPQVAEDAIAHAEFLRVHEILIAIGKDDALYENVINRYCTLKSECCEFEKMRKLWLNKMSDVEHDPELDSETRYKLTAMMQKSVLDADSRVQQKRKSMFDIEKECAMTVASALRSIPKSAAQPKENPLIGLINSG